MLRLFKKEKDGSKRSLTILGIKISYKINRNCNKILAKNKNNEFLQDLYFAGIQYNKNATVSLIKRFIGSFNDINFYLYSKLKHDDKKILILFFLKRFANIDVITEEDAEFLKQQFKKAQELYQSRKSVDEPMEFDYEGMALKFLAPCEIDAKNDTKEQSLMNYYALVHAFFLSEYKLQDFEPKDGQAIFDCGASIGDTALAFRVWYPNSPIYSFESTKENFEYLNKNIQVNNFQNIFINKSFLYSKTGKYNFNENIYKIVAEDTGAFMDTLSLDDYVEKKDIKNIGLIKFDIEGGEQEALKGTIKTIKSQKPILAIPIYHLEDDTSAIPKFLLELDMPMEFSLKWTERRVWGMDCVLFVKFLKGHDEKTN